LSVQPGTTKTTGTDMGWHRMGLQSQLTEPITPFWKQASRWFLFYSAVGWSIRKKVSWIKDQFTFWTSFSQSKYVFKV